MASAKASPSRRATQELEKIKRELKEKCLDTQAGLEILIHRAPARDGMEVEANNKLTEMREINTKLSKKMMRALAKAPLAQRQGVWHPMGRKDP